MSLRAAFAGALPAHRVFDDEPTLDCFADDLTEEEPSRPGIVLFPETVEEVRAIVLAAGRARAPLTVRAAGTNVAGLAIPSPGGAVVDLSRMDRIVEIDAAEMYAVIEPGVTWAAMKIALDAIDPPLRLGYPLSPPHTGVLANCLLDGLGNLSLRHGSMGEWLAGVEAVLPDGTIVRTGSAAASASWCSRGPLPDLTGLFVGWQGATGIATKGAVRLWPAPPLRERSFILAGDRGSAFQAMRLLARTTLCDDIGGLSWPTGRMLFGAARPTGRDSNEPEFFVYVDLTAETERELDLKRRRLHGLLDGLRAAGRRLERPLPVADLVRLEPAFSRFADFPMALDFLYRHPGGGLTWVGTYGPCSRFEEAADRVAPLMDAAGFPPALVSRPMAGGHFGVLRMLARFDRGDPAERRRVREMNRSVLAAVLPLGFLPYKCPPWALPLLREALDPGFAALLERVRAAIDPAGIMSPRCWRFSS